MMAGCTATSHPKVQGLKATARSAPAYTASSPWNTPIGVNPPIQPGSGGLVERVGGRLTSDPTQYTMAVYPANPHGVVRVEIAGNYTDVQDDGTSMNRMRGAVVQIPIPAKAAGAPGTDGQLIVVDETTGDEWGLWQARRDASGRWSATNGYHYNTNWSGVPPEGFGSRGAGIPYLTGLVRGEEIQSGHIEHAIAFAYPSPSCASTPPATKSDGKGSLTNDMPEGARLQLDPTADDRDFDRWGLNGAGRVIARALQRYGMIVVDVSGRPKIYLEAQQTAHWPLTINSRTVSGIPLSSFRVLRYQDDLSTHSCK